MEERYNPMKSAEIAAEHNYNMIDGVLNNQLPALPPEREKKLDKVKEPPNKRRSRDQQSKRLYPQDGPQWVCAPC